MREVELDGKPWVIAPIRTPATPTLYPVPAQTLYLNLGCYCQVRKVTGKPDYWYTRIMDNKCFELGGIEDALLFLVPVARGIRPDLQWSRLRAAQSEIRYVAARADALPEGGRGASWRLSGANR